MNFNFGFSTYKSDILLHLSQWQYWWWFWFSFFWTFYYFLILRTVKNRTIKMNPKINTSLRGRGKWGDFLIAVLPLSWCANILLNSNFILRMFEWQNESSLFTVRIHGKQWYWVYKFDLIDAIDILTVPRNVGNNRWIVGTPEELTVCESYLQAIQLRAQEDWIKNYWKKKIQDDIKTFKLLEASNLNQNTSSSSATSIFNNFKMNHLNYNFLNKYNKKFSFINKNFFDYNFYKSFDFSLDINSKQNKINWNNDNYLNNVIKKIFKNNKQLNIHNDFVYELKDFIADKIKKLKIIYKKNRLKYNRFNWVSLFENSFYMSNGNISKNRISSVFNLDFNIRKYTNLFADLDNLFKFKTINLSNFLDLSDFFDEDNLFSINIFDDLTYDNIYYNYDELDDTWDVDYNLRHELNVGPVRLVKHLLTPEYLKENTDILKFNFTDNNNETSPKVADNGNFWVLKQKRYKKKQIINVSEKKDVEYMSFDVMRNIYRKHIMENIKLITELDFQMDSYTLFKCVRGNKHRTESLPVHLYRRLLRTKKTLVLPAHINMTVVTNSYDVVHSWFLPGLGIKMDCVPGRSTHHSLYLDNIGFYYGQCAEICGRYHHHMPIRLCALPFEHFLVWWQIKGLPKLLRIKKQKKELINHSVMKYTW